MHPTHAPDGTNRGAERNPIRQGHVMATRPHPRQADLAVPPDGFIATIHQGHDDGLVHNHDWAVTAK